MEFAVKQNATTVLPKKRESFFGKEIRPSFFDPAFIQPKLTIGPVDDPYEREADAVADKVMRMSGGETLQTKASPFNIQRKCAHCEEEERNVQMKGRHGARGGMTAPAVVNAAVNAGGQPMDTVTRNFMESRFGYDFGSVQIHNDSLAHRSSSDINALAYTHGNHIVFGSGSYQPETDSGKRLLAHELAHVVQQKSMNSIQRKGKDEKEMPPAKPAFDKETFLRENCFNVDIDPLKANCDFTSYQQAVVRVAKQWAVRKCNRADLAAEIISNEELNELSKLIFHEKPPPRDHIRATIYSVRDKLEKTPIVCKSCNDEECNKGSTMAYVPPGHTFIGLCPLFFSKGNLNETPRFLIHEACHLADVDIDNFFRKRNAEAYCSSGGEKSNYWNNPCPASGENIKNADAWSFFIDRLSITV